MGVETVAELTEVALEDEACFQEGSGGVGFRRLMEARLCSSMKPSRDGGGEDDVEFVVNAGFH